MKKVLITQALILFTFVSLFGKDNILGKSYYMTRKEWLNTSISNYLSGFQRFDYSLIIVEPDIKVSIYINDENDRKDAENILKRWKEQVTFIKNQYEWAKMLNVKTELYFETSSATRK